MARSRRAALLLSFLVVAGGLAIRHVSSRPAHRHIGIGSARLERHRLFTLPKSYKPESLFVAEHDDGFAYVISAPDGERVVHRGAEGPSFRECDVPRLAPKSGALFYWAAEGAADEHRLVLMASGRKLATGFARPGALVFSRDGRRWATASVLLPADREKRPDAVAVWVDGERFGPYADVSVPAFSADGAHVVYLVVKDANAQKVTLVVDGRDKGDTGTLPESAPVTADLGLPSLQRRFGAIYLADGALAVVTHGDGAWSIRRGDERLASYARVVDNRVATGLGVSELDETSAAMLGGSVVAASQAPALAWWERPPGADGRWRVARDGKPDGVLCGKPAERSPIVLSADGVHVAYVCDASPSEGVSEIHAVFDGVRHGPYAGVWSMAVSPDGSRNAWAADSGADVRPWSFYLDGKRRHLRFDRVFPAVFGPDGAHVAWVAERNHRVALFVDGVARASSDKVVRAPSFEQDGSLTWAVLRGRRVSSVRIALAD